MKAFPVKTLCMTRQDQHTVEVTPLDKKRPNRLRWLPLAVLVVAIVVFFASGVQNQFDFDMIAMRYADLSALVHESPVMAIIAVIVLYALATMLSFPAAWLLTVAAGLVLGWWMATIGVVIGATLGASVLFFAARAALADFFKAKAGKTIGTMAQGFREDAVSYMLFLRLAPIFPFTLVNVVPAILGVPFKIFAATTAVGIIPGVIAYTFAGEGLRSIVSERAQACKAGIAPCGTGLSPSDLITTQILIAFALMGIVSLIPVVLKRIRKKRQGDKGSL